MKILTENLELIPHVTLDPTDSKIERTQTQIDELHQYWTTVYSQLAIGDLYKFEEKSWIVPIRYITDERSIRELIKVCVHEILEEELEISTILMSIEGGLSLFQGGALLYEAECCADLTNIADWRNIMGYRQSDWTLLWNGHPQIPVRYSEGMLRFAPLSDDVPTSKSAGVYAIPPDVLAKAVKQADKEVKAFQERLYAYWIVHQDDIWE